MIQPAMTNVIIMLKYRNLVAVLVCNAELNLWYFNKKFL